jgi:hypothetical protein
MRRTDCICGSATLPLDYGPLLDQVISILAGNGTGVAVTCAAGASMQALVRASGLGSLEAVFAVGESSGAGFWAGSGPFCTLQAFGRERIRWLAGGPLTQPLPLRLNERTRACLRFGSASAPDAHLLGFADRPDCPDTFGIAQLAASIGMGVIVFPCGFPAEKLPELSPGGSWVAANPVFWSEARRWLPPRPVPSAPLVPPAE